MHAREEHPREDLLAEAKALVRRVEFALPGEPNPIVVGFRVSGAASFYFGEQPAYHFNADRELRRAFVDDALIKAERGRLVALRRIRTEHETILAAAPFDDSAQRAFLNEFAERLARIKRSLAAGEFTPLRQVPENEDVLALVRDWLDSVNEPPSVANSPRV